MDRRPTGTTRLKRLGATFQDQVAAHRGVGRGLQHLGIARRRRPDLAGHRALQKLGPPVYNQGIKDAQAYVQARVDDLDEEFYEPEERR